MSLKVANADNNAIFVFFSLNDVDCRQRYNLNTSQSNRKRWEKSKNLLTFWAISQKNQFQLKMVNIRRLTKFLDHWFASIEFEMNSELD